MSKITLSENTKQTVYPLTVTALMAAVLCVLGPLTIPIGAIPISLVNFAICLAVWLLGARWGTISVLIYLLIGAVGLPVFSGYGAGLAKLAGPTGGYLIGYLPMAFVGGLVIEKTKGHPLFSGLGLVVGIALCYALGTGWFILQMGCTLSYALTVCVYPFIFFDLCKVVVSVLFGRILSERLRQSGLLKL